MVNNDKKNVEQPFHYESGVPVLDVQNEAQRKAQAEKQREDEYKQAQLALNREQLKVNNRLSWFTFALFVCTLITGGISAWQASIAKDSANAAHDGAVAAGKSAKAAQDTVDLSRKSTHFDQRAWITARFGTDQMSFDKPLTVTVQFNDTGKTAARNVRGTIIVKKLPIDNIQPRFVYDHGTSVIIGTMFPNAPQPAVGYLIPDNIPKGRKVSPVFMTPELKRQFDNGKLYILVYGKMTYEDVFGGKHWMQFCATSTQVLFSSPPACLEYNDVDNNEEP